MKPQDKNFHSAWPTLLKKCLGLVLGLTPTLCWHTGYADTLAPNLYQQGSQNLISGQPLREIPVIRGKGGVLRAQADMISAGFSGSPLAYGDEAVYASRTPFPMFHKVSQRHRVFRLSPLPTLTVSVRMVNPMQQATLHPFWP